ncbi:hypothetical protein ACXIZN_24085 [Amycolatopsis sp. TRM77291]
MRPGSKLTGEHLVLMAEEQHQEGEPACGTVVSATSSVRRGRSLQPARMVWGESCAVRMTTEGVLVGLFAVGDHRWWWTGWISGVGWPGIHPVVRDRSGRVAS